MAAQPKKDADNQEWRDQAVKTLGNLSHSLRNPFATIQSYLNILEMEDYKFDPEGLKEVTHILKDTVDKSLKTIDEKITELKESINSR